MAAKKGKKMTAREKKLAAEARAELREKGLIPAKKKPLNRKKFVSEAKEILLEEIEEYGFDLYLYWALQEMMGHTNADFTLDLEAVGAAKVIHLAKRRQEFEKAQRAQGKEKWFVGELCDAVRDIYKA